MNDRGKKDSERVGNVAWERRNNNVRKEDKEVNTRAVLQVYQVFWKKGEWLNASKEYLGSCDRHEGEIYTKKIYLLSREKREKL